MDYYDLITTSSSSPVQLHQKNLIVDDCSFQPPLAGVIPASPSDRHRRWK
ncbi:hypothetical protein IC582_012311 [Cucumis melo]